MAVLKIKDINGVWHPIPTNIIGESRGNTIEDTAIVNWDLINSTGNTVINLGTGGSTYNGIVTDSTGSHSFGQNGLTLNTKAYAKVSYPFVSSGSWSVSVKGYVLDFGTGSVAFRRLFRGSSDAISIFYSENRASMLSKLSGENYSGHPIIISSDFPNYIKTLNGVELEGLSYSTPHMYTYTCDGSEIKLYVDGVYVAKQESAGMSASTDFGVGDTLGNNGYNFGSILISRFLIFNKALTAEEVAELI